MAIVATSGLFIHKLHVIRIWNPIRVLSLGTLGTLLHGVGTARRGHRPGA